ncbi:hypothetical protein PENSOL_c083G05832 [Penicillium solitum]|uniref:Uncharacterized protein n=1 Tax=Penicillium solitum TaxID=60172 RepID=A0A1V6QCF6_9EURO|nr:uncharacterized protein PENSOL_c083G05832 [Penicillium solitum]OQD86893.1 hypothetical protein PENSOL_c083G05832 [Penicillium solitum]
MVAPGSQWPPLSGGRENSVTNTNERILDANYDVRQLLNHISSNNSVKVPKPVLEYLKSIQELTADLIKNPIGQDWKQQFEQLRKQRATGRPNAIGKENTIFATKRATVHTPGPRGKNKRTLDD